MDKDFKMEITVPYDDCYDLDTETAITIKSECSEIVVPCKNCYSIFTSETTKAPARLWFGCTYFEIRRKVRDKSQRVYADIAYFEDDKELTVRVPVSVLKGSKLETLADYGLDITTDRTIMKVLGRYFTKHLNRFPAEDAEPPLGFIENGDEISFLGYEPGDREPLLVSDSSFKNYLKGLNTLLQGSVPLQLAAVIAVSSTTLAYMRLVYGIPVKSWTVCFTGTSSTGKSTAQILAASMFSSPDDKRLISNFNATSNAACRMIRYTGLPVLFDEATAVGNFNREAFIYQISLESDKKRLNTDLTEKDCGSFITVPILSSEENFLHGNDSSRLGEQVRLMTFYHLEFTQDREHAENIHRFCIRNYGHIGREVVNHLMETEENYEKRYDMQREYLRTQIGKSTCSLSERLISKYALFLLSAEILAELGVDIEYEGIAALLIQHHAEIVKDADPARNAHEALMAYAAANPYAPDMRVCTRDKAVIFSEELFKKVLKQNHFHDPKMIIAALKKKGLILRPEPNRVKTKVTINGVTIWGYKIDMSRSQESSEPKEEADA